MFAERQQCAVCKQMTNLFSYGVPSCNACTLFFRRAVSGQHPIFECKNRQICKDYSLQCRFCRFQQCIQAGMSQIPNKQLKMKKYQGLSNTINNLIYLENYRKHRCMDFYIPEDLDYSVEEIASGVIVRLEKKPKDQKSNLNNWGFMCGFSTMEFMKKFEFVEFFSQNDLQMYLKHSQFSSGVFSNAINSFFRKSEKMTFPDGSEALPDVPKPIFSLEFLNRIRYRLVGRIMELKVTREEYLLLSAILICNPVIPNISDSARALLTTYQKYYTSFLLQYSLINHPDSGPSRFSDLLSLCHVINGTLSDLHNHFQIIKLHYPNLKVRAIIEDSLLNVGDH